MTISDKIKTGAMGAIGGAVVLAIVGFGWGGWLTASNAQAAASEQAQREVVAALLPVCLDQAKRDPNYEAGLAKVKSAPSYQRTNAVMESGWATVPTAKDPNRNLAEACAEALVK